MKFQNFIFGWKGRRVEGKSTLHWLLPRVHSLRERREWQALTPPSAIEARRHRVLLIRKRLAPHLRCFGWNHNRDSPR
jgi:hypothetical protein